MDKMKKTMIDTQAVREKHFPWKRPPLDPRAIITAVSAEY